MTNLEQLKEAVNGDSEYDRVECVAGVNSETGSPVGYLQVYDDPDDENPYVFCKTGNPGETEEELLEQLAIEALKYLF